MILEDLLYCAVRGGRIENTDVCFFLLLNFGRAFSASVRRASLSHNPLVFSAFRLSAS